MIEPDGCRMSPPYLYVPPQPKDTTFVETICEGEIYVDGDFSASEEGNYQYTLIASNGCDSTINLTIAYCDLYVPNVFSPNFDGLNDTFKIYGKDLSDNYTMYIYDRWGNLLFEGLEWDGRVNGEPAAVGVYIYMVQLNDASTDNVLLKGSVSLLR
jgi:gliding motility-associated-like protein